MFITAIASIALLIAIAALIIVLDKTHAQKIAINKQGTAHVNDYVQIKEEIAVMRRQQSGHNEFIQQLRAKQLREFIQSKNSEAIH